MADLEKLSCALRRRPQEDNTTPVLGSIASLGLFFFLFPISLQLDLRSVRQSRRRASAITATGMALSITTFPVLARILAELKLLTTSIRETVLAAAALNDVAAAGVQDRGEGGRPSLIRSFFCVCGLDWSVNFTVVSLGQTARKPLVEKENDVPITEIGKEIDFVLYAGIG